MDGISLNYLAIGAAVIANFIFGFLWYGPLFGKIWAQEMELPPGYAPQPRRFILGAVLMTIGSFFTIWVLAHNMFVWRFFGIVTMPQTPVQALPLALSAAGFSWLGFYLPQSLSQKLWEGYSWKLVTLQSAHNLIGLSISALILAHWR